MKILNNSPTLWAGECHDLASRAWSIRRAHAARLNVPVSMVPWKRCLLEAKAIEAAQLAQSCWNEASSCPAFGYAFYAPVKPVAPRSSLTPVRVASIAIIALLALLVA